MYTGDRVTEEYSGESADEDADESADEDADESADEDTDEDVIEVTNDIERPKCTLVIMPLAHQIKQFFELPNVFAKMQAFNLIQLWIISLKVDRLP